MAAPAMPVAIVAVGQPPEHAYPKDRFPTEAVYGDIDHAGLRLITCGGDFDQPTHYYVDNIVVYANFVASGVTTASRPATTPPA